MTLVVESLLAIGFNPPTTLAADPVVVINCTPAGLAAAISTAATTDPNNPGLVTFDCPDNIIEFSISQIDIGDVVSPPVAVLIDGRNRGGDPIILDGQDNTRFFYVSGNGHLTLQYLTFQHGKSNVGGAIDNRGTLTISQSIFSRNQVNANGGAISNDGTLTISQSSFSHNQAEFGGGAISNHGILTISQSTFSDNQADYGGAIYNIGTLTITSSTFSGNIASTYGSTIGQIAETATISWSTIIQPANTEEALFIHDDLTLTGVILGGETSHCEFQSDGTLTDSYTLANGTSCGLDGTGSQQNVPNLSLGPLTTSTVNGVEQSYYPLLESSPAIDGGPSTCDTTIDPDTLNDPDQIGTPRPGGPRCDIGAIEHIFSATLCANRWNGSLSMANNQGCSRSETTVQLPQSPAPTACANTWNGTLRLADDCTRSEHQITLWSFHSHPICINRWNGTFRLSTNCTRSEHPDLL